MRRSPSTSSDQFARHTGKPVRRTAARYLATGAFGFCAAALLWALPVLHASAQATVPSAESETAAQIGGIRSPNTQKLVFEVATIKPSGQDETTNEQLLPDGYRITQRSLKAIISAAYFPAELSSEERLKNAPAWTNEFYDVVGKVAPEDVAEWQRQTRDLLNNKGLQSALQALLTERCKLVAHRISAEVVGYDLIAGRHGARLKLTPLNEVFPPDASVAADGTRSAISFRNDRVEVAFYNASMKEFAAELSSISRAPIRDETGLTGRYDFVLDDTLPVSASSDDMALTTPSARWDVGSVGLRLQSAKVPVTTLVIDHIQRPSPN